MEEYSLKLSLEIRGNSEDDLADAMREAMRLVSEGYTSGFDKNEFSKFTFTVEKS